ncbi:MAG: uncharacterized protein QOJ00_1943 [Actinomycetota bacterium]
MNVVVLADTHIGDNSSTRLTPAAWDAVRQADLVLHAGDIVGDRFLRELRDVVDVRAVLGNNDTALRGALPETLEFEYEGVPIAMVHDSGPRTGRERRMHRRFPNARLVVFGHSHIPWNAPGVDGQLLFNPGSATQRRRQPHKTIGLLHLHAGDFRAAIAEVD